MAPLIQIRNAHKSYGHQVLLDGADASIVEDAKIGFVGRNGAGKSTLLRLILDEEELDAGEIIKHPRLRIGYLRQHDPFEPGESAMDFLMRDSDQPEWRCGEVAAQFELKGKNLDGPVAELSGGWQTRVKLAALLLHDPNLLLLDEPTNFLDLRTQILLEHFLRRVRAGCLVVSHDRAFLTQTCDKTLDLTRGKLTMYPGKIDEFLEFQRERIEHDLRVNATVMAKQKQLQRFVDKNRGSPKTSSQARSKQKQLDRLELTDIESNLATAHIRAPVVEPRKGVVLRCTELSIGYPGHNVAAGINLEIEHGQRAAIVGDNGEGKTTLLRSLVGSLESQGGEIKWGHATEIGTYAQHVYSSLPEDRTVMDYLEYQATPGMVTQDILQVAGALLFRDEHLKKKIAVLSGGERARLCMAGLLLGTYNVLVMDEPGNHLDVETVESLANALLAYKGTVLFTSHDRHFMSRIATNIIEVRAGCARNYMGDYEAYLYSINKEIDEGERQLASATSGRKQRGKSRSVSNEKPAATNRDLQKEHRKRQKEIKNLEKKIERFTAEQKELNQRLLETTDSTEALTLHHDLTEVTEKLNDIESRWLELSEEA